MKEFLEIICTSSLFSDIAETEVSDMLSCLEAREKLVGVWFSPPILWVPGIKQVVRPATKHL